MARDAPINGWPGFIPHPVLHDHIVDHTAISGLCSPVHENLVPVVLRQLRGERPGINLQGVQQAMNLQRQDLHFFS